MTDHERTGYLLAGLPGAGKSAAAELIEDMTGGTVVETGDVVRHAAEQHGLDNPDSEALGDFAAEMREIRGNAFATEVLVGEILRGERDIEWPLILTGVRHEDEVNEARNFLDQSQLLYVKAASEVRLERLQDRAREGEAEFTQVDLMQRDQRELEELGLETIRSSDRIDSGIENEDTLDDLRAQLDNELWYRE